ncbi:MAG: NAD(P)-dependent oxidoreductase [Actinocatenispora sp.]
MTAPIAFVTAEWPESGHRALRELGYEVRAGGWGVTGRALDTAELVAAAAGAAVLIVEVERVDDEVLDGLPDVQVVCTARGTPSNVDIEACTRRRIALLNTPARNADSVADFTMGLILSCARGISAGERHLRDSGWLVGDQVPYLHFRGPELYGRTLGLVGFGEVGKRVATRAERGFGMRVVHHDPYQTGGVDLPTLLRTSDVVSLHCARSEQTRHLIDGAALSLMKPTSILVNTAGGDMVDPVALVAALTGNRLAGAALDVYPEEPLPADSALLGTERLILTPHLAGAAQDVAEHHTEMICDDLALLATGDQPMHCVNAEGVLPIVPPGDFAVMRGTQDFIEGMASSELAPVAQ